MQESCQHHKVASRWLRWARVWNNNPAWHDSVAPGLNSRCKSEKRRENLDEAGAVNLVKVRTVSHRLFIKCELCSPVGTCVTHTQSKNAGVMTAPVHTTAAATFCVCDCVRMHSAWMFLASLSVKSRSSCVVLELERCITCINVMFQGVGRDG